MPETRAPAARRLLNVSLLGGSGAHRAYDDRSGSSISELTADELTAGFPPRPGLNLRFFGGRTIAHLVFANHYLGGAAARVSADIASIDAIPAATCLAWPAARHRLIPVPAPAGSVWSQHH